MIQAIENSIFGEGSQISTNQKGESTVFSLLIGRNLRPFPENTVVHFLLLSIHVWYVLSVFIHLS